MRGAWTQLFRQRLAWLAIGGVVVLGAGWYAASRAWFVYPRGDAVTDVDAVVALAGSGERREAAQALVERGVSEVLAVSNGGSDEGLDCGQDEPYEVICFVPDPARSGTLGEALAVRSLAEEQGWESIAVVTSDYHLFRTRVLMDRCVPARVAMVPVRSATAPWAQVLPEQGKLLGSLPLLLRC